MKKIIIWKILLLLFFARSSFAQENITPKIITGSDNDFMIVKHYILKGTNRKIGRDIAQIAKSLKVEIRNDEDTLRNRLRGEYLKQNYPIHYERMLGVADEYGINYKDFSKDFSFLSYFPSKASCTVVFYPSNQTANKHNIFSRNLDMPNDAFRNGLHIYSRPIVFEVYPDTGYASIYIITNDILGGAGEGINSQGLCVAVLGDETANHNAHPGEPSFEVGLNERLIMRYLLDNCKNVEEAKESLLRLKQYYQRFPLHYLIADNNGKSFVFEFSRHRNQSRIVEGDGIQYLTNHVISNNDLSDAQAESLERYNIVKSQISKTHTYTIDEIKLINSTVSPWMPDYRPQWPSARTLWHSIYDLDSKTVSVKFYLGEIKDPNNKEKIITKYSDYTEFKFKE